MDRVKRFFWTVCTQTFPFAQIALMVVLFCLFIEHAAKQNGNPKPAG